jgi:superfamily II DNA or RNA helicase
MAGLLSNSGTEPNQTNIEAIQQGRVLEGPFWPERVRVVSLRKIGANLETQTVGVKTNRFYPRILSESDLQKVKVLELEKRDFKGDPEAFFLAVEGNRIRFAHQFDPLYGVNVSQIDPLPHQIDAVYHFILKHPRVRFLLADDPGAGKTIMAGLVLRELKQRGLVERTLIVVPGHLQEQWLRELKEKFGESFRLCDRAVMDASWGRNIWAEERQAITSMDFAKQSDVMMSLADVEYDLVIVDEAHKMAAYQYGEKLSRTERYKLGELLSRNTKFLLFLTATPDRGDPENFRLFLDLLEPGFFATTQMLQESINNKDNPLFLRRLKEDLKGFDGTPLFPPRKVNTVKYRLSNDEKLLYNAVTEYVQRYYGKAVAKGKRNVAFALIVLQRRVASSVRAIRRSLERRRARLQELYDTGKIVQEQGYIDEDVLEDMSAGEREKLEDELLEKLTSADTLEELNQEITKLDELVKLAKDAEKKETEAKLTQLRDVMALENLKKDEKNKLLVFTESRDTLEYLVEKIRSWGYSVCTIHGGMNLERRIQSENEFRQTTQIMVSTEAGGEGINLQFCWLMVNYDIPWNPNRLEQRMGRVHRYGQQSEVHIYNLVAIDTREGRILDRLFDKMETMRLHLGSDRVFDVIGDVVSAKNLKDLIIDAITNKRTMEDILRDFDRITDEEAVQKLREATMEALATRNIDFTGILGEARAARENRLIPEYIEKFFIRAAAKVGVRLDRRADGFYRIETVPYEIRNVSFDFKTKYGEPFREYNKFGFDKAETFKKQAEFVAPGHPLLEVVVERIFQTESQHLERGTSFLDPSGKFNGLIWFTEAEVNDGSGLTAGKRIFTLYQDQQGTIQPVSPSVLWDLKGVTTNDRGMSFGSEPDEDILAFMIEHILPSYLDELTKQRLHDAEIKTRYGVKSLEILIGESEAKLIDYETRRARGENLPDITIQNEQRNKQDLNRKKNLLQKQIEAETHLLPSTPRIIGVALVSPGPIETSQLRRDPEIELIGVRIASEFERRDGREPHDVSGENLGFDIKSIGADALRYIEVKARAEEGSIVLTPNEWLMANRLGNDYWLYVVVNAAKQPELYLIQNPASKLRPTEHREIVRYFIEDWKQYSNKAP